MQNLQDYRTYYNLESYLFDTVGPAFHKNKCLTAFDLFAIVIWKAERNKGRVKNGFLVGKSKMKHINDILRKYHEKNLTREGVVTALDSISGIGIPTASAILTVLYPKDFTVVDVRAKQTFKRDDLRAYCGQNQSFTVDPSNNVSGYVNEYLVACKKAADGLGLTLREFDKVLWGYSFHEDLKNFVLEISDDECTAIS